MIEKLQIRNFRTHERLDIDFSPLVNSIIGRNAIGKSTIVRAIRWVVINKPAGDSIINWDANKASVRLTIDGDKITRTRGRDINTYRLNKNKPYKAFGKNKVPKDIEEVINLSDINFQGQHEAPFWFCETAGEVSRQLNAIVNLERIDKTLSNLSSALHKTRTIIEVIESRLDKAIIRQNSLIHIEQMNEDLERVENLQEQYQGKRVKCSLLGDILKLVLLYRRRRESASELVSDSKLAISKGLIYQKITVQVENLSKAVELGESLSEIVNKKPPSLNHLEALKREQEVITNQYDILEELTRGLKVYKEIKCQIEKDLVKCKKELKEIAGGRCPLCGAIKR